MKKSKLILIIVLILLLIFVSFLSFLLVNKYVLKNALVEENDKSTKNVEEMALLGKRKVMV